MCAVRLGLASMRAVDAALLEGLTAEPRATAGMFVACGVRSSLAQLDWDEIDSWRS